MEWVLLYTIPLTQPMIRFLKTHTCSFFAYCLIALVSYAQIPALDIAAEYHCEPVYNHGSWRAVSNARVIRGEVQYGSPACDAVSLSSGLLFLVTNDGIHDFRTENQLIRSSAFVDSMREEFRLLGYEDALRFQDFLFLLDERWSGTCFFRKGNDWFFVRRKFFDDISAWKVSTDANGKILSIGYDDAMDVAIPEDAYDDSSCSEYNEPEAWTIEDSTFQRIREVLKARFEFSESIRLIESAELGMISDAQIQEIALTLSEEYEDEEYGLLTESSHQVLTGFYRNGILSCFDSFDDLLVSPEFLASIRTDFRLDSPERAAIFEAMLDQTTSYFDPEKLHRFEDPVWCFVRDESFGNKQGYAVTVDVNGMIMEVAYRDDLGLVIEEEEFDENTVDWGFVMTEPHGDRIEVVEGSTVPFTIEFNETAASRIGAWVMSRWDGTMVSMVAGTDIYSPFGGEIPSEATTMGAHLLEIFLMRPGTDTSTALGCAEVAVSVIPFDDSEVSWDLKMETPVKTSLNTNAGESIPVVLTYNATDANRLGVRLEIIYQGEKVGGQMPPHHESPFETAIPGSVLTQGAHSVDFVLVSPKGDKELGKCSLKIQAH